MEILNVAEMNIEPEIPKFYANKKILITGATGFIGKVLLWKLLHSCPQIDTIYVLIRSKYGKSTVSRKEDLLNFMIFDNLKKENPKILDKISVICGDVGEENLGLSEVDREKLINNVSIVFHGAAILKMDADLKRAVNVNTEGTLRVLELGREMKSLQSFIYISTAYCCCDEQFIQEKLYTLKETPRDIIQLIRWIEPDMLEIITPSLLKQLPNTYTYTKRLAEGLLEEFKSDFPIVVARPTIVIPSLKEPVPGWVDNLNGPIGLSIAVAKGVMRIVYCNPDMTADMVPADIVINGLIALAWKCSVEQRLNNIQVYNLALAEAEPITWREIHDKGWLSCEKYPFEKMLWYPAKSCFYQNKTLFWFMCVILHWIPAYFIDFIMILAGQKTFMVHIQNKIAQGQKVLFYFAMHEWKFQAEAILRLKNSMNLGDQRLFPVTMKHLVNRQGYMDNVILTARKVLMKDDPSTIPECRRKLKRMYYLHCFVKIVLYSILVKIMIDVFSAGLNVFVIS